MNPNEIQHGGDHYKKAGNAQHWDMLPHCGFGWEYYIGAATKYATRVKDPENDPKKIVHFIDKLIWLIEQGLVPPEFQTVGGKRDFDFGSVPYSKRVYVNDWLRKRYRRRAHQRVLQTWHGTMLKKLALDRGLGLRTRIAVLRERDRWDVLLAQNPYAARIFRSAYAMKRPIWEEGYPRNDVLHDPARAAHVRSVIGVPADARVVL